MAAMVGTTLAACAHGEYATVTVSYDDASKDSQAKAWRVFMEALDHCHISGYQDAQPAGPPQRQCKAGDADHCSLFRVTLTYDCVGMGYQTSD